MEGVLVWPHSSLASFASTKLICKKPSKTHIREWSFGPRSCVPHNSYIRNRTRPKAVPAFGDILLAQLLSNGVPDHDILHTKTSCSEGGLSTSSNGYGEHFFLISLNGWTDTAFFIRRGAPTGRFAKISSNSLDFPHVLFKNDFQTTVCGKRLWGETVISPISRPILCSFLFASNKTLALTFLLQQYLIYLLLPSQNHLK